MPKTKHSLSELEASRLAPWRPVQADSPTASSPCSELRSERYPLARLIAESALARTESRGVHRRSDQPRLDPELDGRHVVVAADGSIRLERWGGHEGPETA